MGSFSLGRSHSWLDVFIGMHILLNISLVGCSGKLTVLAFVLQLDERYSHKLSYRFRILNTCLSNLDCLQV